MLQKANILITGPPGCGKSTLVTRIISSLQKKGIKVGGITTPDFRSAGGHREGFLILDIATGEKSIMASVEIHSKIRVGRYGVDRGAVRGIGVMAIEQAVTKADIVIIDEIGKMELVVPEFQHCVTRALDSTKPVLGTIGLNITSFFAQAIKQRPDVTVLRLIREQQDALYQNVTRLIGVSNT